MVKQLSETYHNYIVRFIWTILSYFLSSIIIIQESIKGNIQLPKPPIATGITKKKIMKIACAVTTTLKIWSEPRNLPHTPISNRIMKDILAPTNPDQMPNAPYNNYIQYWNKMLKILTRRQTLLSPKID